MPARAEPESNAVLGRRLENAVADATSRVQRGRQASAEAESRARIEERLRGLELELADVKSRLNGLYLVIASTVLAQVLLKVAT